jgi:hypothetical protein
MSTLIVINLVMSMFAAGAVVAGAMVAFRLKPGPEGRWGRALERGPRPPSPRIAITAG